MNQISTSTQTETSNEDCELSMSELNIVAGGDCYMHNPRGSQRELTMRDSGKSH